MYNSLGYFYLKDILDKGASVTNAMSVLATAGKDIGLMRLKYDRLKSVQESINLKHMPLEQARKFKNNANLLAENDANYLIYKMKQEIKPRMDNIDIGAFNF